MVYVYLKMFIFKKIKWAKRLSIKELLDCLKVVKRKYSHLGLGLDPAADNEEGADEKDNKGENGDRNEKSQTIGRSEHCCHWKNILVYNQTISGEHLVEIT